MKKFIHFSIGPILGALISFITIPLTTYFISPEEYGKASMFMLVQVLLAAYLYLGVDQAYTREYHEVDNKVLLLQNALVLPLTITTIIMCLFLMNMNRLASLLFGEPGHQFLIILLIISMYGMVFERFLLLSIRMEEKALSYSLFMVITKLIVLVTTLCTLLLWRSDFIAVIYSTIGGQLVADLIFIFIFRSRLKFRKKHMDKKLIKKMIFFGIPIFIAFSLEGIFTTMDRFSLKMLSDYKQLGLYTAALKVAGLIKIFQSSFTSLWIPTAYRWYQERKPMEYYQAVNDIVVAIFSVIFMICMLIKNCFPLLFPSEYHDIVYIIPFLLLAPIFYTVSETTTLGIVFSRKTYLNICVSVISVVVNIFCLYFFVPNYGAIGAALSLGITYFIFYCMRSTFSIKIWPGLKFKTQIFNLVLLFIGAWCNTFLLNRLYLINFGILFLLLCFNFMIVKNINKHSPFFRNIYPTRKGF